MVESLNPDDIDNPKPIEKAYFLSKLLNQHYRMKHFRAISTNDAIDTYFYFLLNFFGY